jgi:CBS-domain-containing membrane protein
MQGIPIKQSEFTDEDIDLAMEYLKERMHIIQDDMQPFFLNQYSNPVL